MSFNPDDIKKVAHLARLSISEPEIPGFADNLSKILDLVAQINDADTQGITPMAHPLEQMTQRLREDEVTESNLREEFQAVAPKTEAGLYLVPKVIDAKDS